MALLDRHLTAWLTHTVHKCLRDQIASFQNGTSLFRRRATGPLRAPMYPPKIRIGKLTTILRAPCIPRLPLTSFLLDQPKVSLRAINSGRVRTRLKASSPLFSVQPE